jgi:hypothetical protein
VRDEARKFAAQGYTAIVADMYGDAKTADNPKDAGALSGAVRKQLWRLGGSHAQRDLFTLILLDSASRTGDIALAKALRAERAALRPNGALPPQLTAVKE